MTGISAPLEIYYNFFVNFRVFTLFLGMLVTTCAIVFSSVFIYLCIMRNTSSDIRVLSI